MDISEVSKASGIAASAIRFYEEKGLVRSIGRKGLKRLFPSNILEHLAVITLARAAGFSLTEISSMATLEGRKIDKRVLLAKADELDQRIKAMTTMRNGLRHAAACTAPNHFECPKFLRLLRISSKSRPKSRHNALGKF